MKTPLTSPMTHLFAALLLVLAAGLPCRASNLYVSNGSNTIEEFTPGGVGTVFANSGLSSPYGLAFDTAGNLYVANGGNNTIEKFTPGGELLDRVVEIGRAHV